MIPTKQQLAYPIMQKFAKLWGWDNAIELIWPTIIALEQDKLHEKVKSAKPIS